MGRVFTIVCVGLLLAFPLKAAEQKDLAIWLKDLRVEALAKGIRAETFDRAFTGFKPIPRIIELDRRQPEFTMTFPKYLSRVVPKSRVLRGRAK